VCSVPRSVHIEYPVPTGPWLSAGKIRNPFTRHGAWESPGTDLPQRSRPKVVPQDVGSGVWYDGLARCSKADPRKVAIARAIWEQTVVPQKWLADRLGMRSAANVSQRVAIG